MFMIILYSDYATRLSLKCGNEIILIYIMWLAFDILSSLHINVLNFYDYIFFL